MRVAVLGGGLQGCCLALALADRGVHVTLYDRNSSLMTRAAVANEGKIHLGYMYVADPTLQTAKAMLRGALSFAPFMKRYLGLSSHDFELSEPATYVVHRHSQKSADETEAYLNAVHALALQHPASDSGYFDIDLKSPIRRWHSEDVAREFDPEQILAAFESPEVAIDPVHLAGIIRDRVAQSDCIEVCTEHTVVAVENDNPVEVVSRHNGIAERVRFDHVANTLWDGRIAIDDARGNRPNRPWIHRLKYGVDLHSPSGVDGVRSITIVCGPFGEVVKYGDGSLYLTWYPSCVVERTSDVAPPIWQIEPQEPVHSAVLWGTYNGLKALQPALGQVPEEAVASAAVRGGPIVAWGETDIDDPESELHCRYEIGVTSEGCYHSVDPGKLTAAPYFAAQCAERIAGPDKRKSYALFTGVNDALSEADGRTSTDA